MRGESPNAVKHYVPTCSSTQYTGLEQYNSSNVPVTDYVSDVFSNTSCTQYNDVTKEQPMSRLFATAYDAQDVYKKLRIIYFCDDMDLIQVASISVTVEGIRFVNMATGSAVVPDLLPSSIFFSQDLFKSYDVYLSDKPEIDLLINFTTLMDFLENTLSNAPEDIIHPLHIAFDKWLYISMQQTPSIQDLGMEVSTTSLPPASRFCFVPSELLGAIGDQAQTVPESIVDTPSIDSDDIAEEEIINNAILMLHPLNYKHVDKSSFFTYLPSQNNINTICTSTITQTTSVDEVPSLMMTPVIEASEIYQETTANSEISRTSQDLLSGTPKKRLKTSTEQVELLEEWFKRNPLPTKQLKEQLSQQLEGVSLRQVEVWFQNRRAKQKKADAKSTSVNNPPSPCSPVPSSGSIASPLASPLMKKIKKRKHDDPSSPFEVPETQEPYSPVTICPISESPSSPFALTTNKKIKSNVSSMISNAALLPEVHAASAGGGSQ